MLSYKDDFSLNKYSGCSTWISVVVARRRRSFMTRGLVLLGPGLKLTSPELQGEFLTTGLQGKFLSYFF